MYQRSNKAIASITPCFLPILIIGTTQAANEEQPHTAREAGKITITNRVKRAHIPLDDVRWPYGIVPYVLTNATPQARQVFLEAAHHISMNSSLIFIERTNEQDYIYLANDHHYPFCNSYKGRIGGPQVLNLSPSCQTKSRALHEIMHAVGFLHEHQRTDRIKHVKMHENAITKQLLKPQYEVNPNGVPLGDYDLDSVMHYEFDKNFVLRNPMNPVRPWPRDTLSKGDIKALTSLYGSNQYMAAAPTDNGLSVVLSKHELIIPENGTGKLVLQILPDVALSGTPLIESENPLITATIDSQTGNIFTLNIKAQSGVATETPNRVFFHFHTAAGKAGTGIFTVNVVGTKQLPDQFRQLVSLWQPKGSTQKHCLEARRLPNNIEHDATPDVEALYAAFKDDELLAMIAPCDSNKSLQLWQQNANGHFVSRSEVHCLSPVSPINDGINVTFLRLTKCSDQSTPAYQWRYEDGKLISVAYPRSALTLTAGNIPALNPINARSESWQQWYWY